MPLQILSSPTGGDDVARELERAISGALPDASVQVTPKGGGHFEIQVVSATFANQSRVRQQQRVYAAIAHLMQGDAAPVHAIDRLQTELP